MIRSVFRAVEELSRCLTHLYLLVASLLESSGRCVDETKRQEKRPSVAQGSKKLSKKVLHYLLSLALTNKSLKLDVFLVPTMTGWSLYIEAFDEAQQGSH